MKYRLLILATLTTVVAVGCQGAISKGDKSTRSKPQLSHPAGSSGVRKDYSAIEEFNQIAKWGLQGAEALSAAQNALYENIGLQEEYTRICMEKEGFKYFKQLPERVSANVALDPDRPYGLKSWVMHYGLGISTLSYPQSKIGNDLVGYIDELSPGYEDSDPSTKYLLSLSPSESKAYYLALSGPPISTDEILQGSFVTGGCTGEARAKYPDKQLLISEILGAQLRDVEDRIDADPDLKDYEERIVKCIDGKGIHISRYRDLKQLIVDRLVAERLREEGPPIWEEPKAGSVVAGAADLADKPSNILTTGTEEWRAALKRVQSYERDIARTALECKAGPLDWSEARESVAAPYRERFMDEHWSTIESLLTDKKKA